MTASALYAAYAEPRGADELAPLLLAVAAWALADEDTIDLAPLEHPRPVDGRLGFTRKRAYSERPGLEGLLLRSMTGADNQTRGVSVAGLLTTGLPMGFESEARHDSVRHAIETGAWKRKPRRVVRLARKGGDGSELDYQQVRGRFDAFARAYPGLHAALLEDCRAGLA